MWKNCVFIVVIQNKLLNKQSSCCWFETTWRRCDVIVVLVDLEMQDSHNTNTLHLLTTGSISHIYAMKNRVSTDHQRLENIGAMSRCIMDKSTLSWFRMTIYCSHNSLRPGTFRTIALTDGISYHAFITITHTTPIGCRYSEVKIVCRLLPFT